MVADVARRAVSLGQGDGLRPECKRGKVDGVLVAGIPTNPATGAVLGFDLIARFAIGRFQADGLVRAEPDAGVTAIAAGRVDVGCR